MGKTKRRKRIGYGLAALAVAIAASFLASIRPGDKALYPAAPDAEAVTIYLIDNGFHTDLALPRALVMAHGGATARAAANIQARDWLLVGWGDAGFYTASGFSTARILDGLRALFAPSNPSVIHLYGVARPPDLAFGPEVATPVRLSSAGFSRMMLRIDRSFALSGKDPIAATPPEGGHGFFRSVEHFSILKVCNHWTGEVLNAAGLPIIGWLHLTSRGLLMDLRWRAGVQPTPS